MGFAAHLFFVQMQTTSEIQEHIEHRLSGVEPEVEVLLAEQVGAERVRLFIDHPDGVDLALCERVTESSARPAPGVRARGLVTRARTVRSPSPSTSAATSAAGSGCARARRIDGAKSFSGELVEAADDAVSVAADAGIVRIPFADIHKSNLLEG